MRAGELFDRRYYLIKRLGDGASAEVWKAADTKANNLIVAVKIFSDSSGMDTYGIQNFASEFTAVHDLNHTNLLKPLSYEICKGTPYLILQYCKNGSAKGMIGQAEEEDVIKLLHDVAAGLEYLHEHDIVHQDIKPDNILLDDNCNFLVTDFGISVASTGDVSATSGSAGTTAYMAPERFDGTPAVKASDIWSLGATAFELATGDVPFGDYGGMVQASGESIPLLPESYQPEVKEMITACLAQQPWNRPFARDIRQKIDVYWETGSWKRKDMRKVIWGIAASIAFLFLCAGLYYWDYNRTKVYYYKDYAEFFGIPKGIYKLDGDEMSHRMNSYRMEYSQRKLRRMSLVNSAGRVINHSDSEYKNTRFPDTYYFYSDRGSIDYKKVYDEFGKLLYKMDYDENMKKVVFKLDDEFSTETTLPSNTTENHRDNISIFDAKSNISAYKLNFDNNGLLMRVEYSGYQNINVLDDNGIHGMQYKYDEKGRIIECAFLNLQGNVCANKIGLGVKQYTYDKDDNWESIAYLTPEYKQSQDGHNIPIITHFFDKYGNNVKEIYHDKDGKLYCDSKEGVAGFTMTYDERGNLTEQTCLGLDQKPTYHKYGIVSVKYKYDENGFMVERNFYDIDGHSTCLVDEDQESASREVYVLNEKGQHVETLLYDEHGQPMPSISGAFISKCEYDESGNQTLCSYFDENNNPVKYNGFYTEQRTGYDSFGRVVSISYYDNGEPTNDENGVSMYRAEYNLAGNLTKYVCYDTTHVNMIISTEGYASFERLFDENGNLKSVRYYDTQGRLINTQEGYAIDEYLYDEKTNLVIEERYSDKNKKLIFVRHLKHDDLGNIIEQYEVNANGTLRNGNPVYHWVYDKQNHEVKKYATSLSGKLVNISGSTYSIQENEYDEMGNVVDISFYDTNSRATNDENGVHRYTIDYDYMNRQSRIVRFDVHGNLSKATWGAAETRFEYDGRNNEAKRSFYDGNGQRMNVSGGYSYYTCEYNDRNKLVNQRFYDKNERPVIHQSEGYHKLSYKYNDKGKLIEEACFDTNGKPINCASGYHRIIFVHKDNNEYDKCKAYTAKDSLLATFVWTKNGWKQS